MAIYCFLFDLCIPSLGFHFNKYAFIAYGIIITAFTIKFAIVGIRIRAGSKVKAAKKKAEEKEKPELKD